MEREFSTMGGRGKRPNRKNAKTGGEKPVEFKVRLMVENRPLELSDLVNLNIWSPNIIRLLALYGHPIEPLADDLTIKSEVKEKPHRGRYFRK